MREFTKIQLNECRARLIENIAVAYYRLIRSSCCGSGVVAIQWKQFNIIYGYVSPFYPLFLNTVAVTVDIFNGYEYVLQVYVLSS